MGFEKIEIHCKKARRDATQKEVYSGFDILELRGQPELEVKNVPPPQNGFGSDNDDYERILPLLYESDFTTAERLKTINFHRNQIQNPSFERQSIFSKRTKISINDFRKKSLLGPNSFQVPKFKF